MRQMPHYLVIGSGRMASHFCHYLTLLGLPFTNWSRRNHSEKSLFNDSRQCSHVLLLISDQSIDSFLSDHVYLKEKKLAHFSGQLYLEEIPGVHPLMTFSHDLYDLQTYQSIPFVLEEGGPELSEILPNISNRSFKIPPELKSYYHALCVMSSNFTCILWQKFFKELEQRFHFPQELGIPYLTQTFKNIIRNPKSALTGPLIRNDIETISAHLDALSQDEYKNIYQAFVQVFLR